MSLSLTLLLLVIAVLTTAPITRALGRASGWPLAGLYLAATLAFLPAAGAVLRGEPPEVGWSWVPGLDVTLAFRADGIGVVFTLIALLIGAVVFAYSTRYLAPGRQLSFYLVMTAFTLSMVGLVLADDLIVLFLCWELTSLASFLLIARSGGAGGETASMRTLLITFLGGLTFLAAVTAIGVRTGTTSVTDALAHPVWREDPTFTAVAAVLVLVSAFTKSAQFPFHSWLPDAMAADTPVSAYLHAAAVVKAGIFLLLRFSPAFHETPVWNVTLITVGLFTGAMGAVFAFTKTDLKKLMAYSTVSQLGLIVATIGIGTPEALTAAVIHTIAHALFKSGLFMMVGVVDHAAHTRDLRRLPELRRQMPLAFWTMVLGCASMAGVPPMLGFVSKEAILAAARDVPGPAWASWLTVLGVAVGAALTMAYCVKIVWAAFVDGPREPDRNVRSDPWLLVPAALPIVVGLPLAVVVFVLDAPVARAVEAALPVGPRVDPHLVLWHGFTLELVITAAVLAAGALVVARRRTLRRRWERDLLHRDGSAVFDSAVAGVTRSGRGLSRLVAADHPTRHVAVQLVAVSAVVLVGALGASGSTTLPAPVAGLSQPIDAVVLLLVLGGVAGVVLSHSRLGATVSLGAVGVMVTVQIFALGAPDVGMTQLLVESLTVIVIMLVLQKLPLTFGRSEHRARQRAVTLALVAGVAAVAATWLLTGRRERSEVGLYYLQEGPGITQGANIVNTILVEFRALDTLGELAVLGMAGVAMIAVLSTVRDRYLDPEPGRDRDHRAPAIALRAEGTRAYAAMETAWGNAIPMQLLIRATVPLLAVASVVLFYRGHNEPGGGFIAALVGSGIVGLIYLSRSRDEQVGPPRLPLWLIGGGVGTAIGSGLLGLALTGSFLGSRYGYVLGQGVSTSLIFDVGVYTAVLGLVLVAFNLLGATRSGAQPGSDEAHEGTRERVDEAVEGELSGPLDSSRGESAPHAMLRPTRRSRYLDSGTGPGGAR